MRDTNYPRIWLQPGNGDERTWCQDKVYDDDVEYVRADLSTASAAPRVTRRSDDKTTPMPTLLRAWAHNEWSKPPKSSDRNEYLIALLHDAADELDAATSQRSTVATRSEHRYGDAELTIDELVDELPKIRRFYSGSVFRTVQHDINMLCDAVASLVSKAQSAVAAASPLGGLAEVIAEYDRIVEGRLDPRDAEADFVMRGSDWRVIREALSPQSTVAAWEPTDDTDGADWRAVLASVRVCASCWKPDVRLLGNIRAEDIERAITEAESALPSPPSSISSPIVIEPVSQRSSIAAPNKAPVSIEEVERTLKDAARWRFGVERGWPTRWSQVHPEEKVLGWRTASQSPPDGTTFFPEKYPYYPTAEASIDAEMAARGIASATPRGDK